MTTSMRLAAKMEPFDSFWEGPKDIEKGYGTFYQFYKHNYLQHMPADKSARILVISCGPGYFLNTLRQAGYNDVLGIDSEPAKIETVQRKGLTGRLAEAFPFLEGNTESFDAIFCETEINHLTKDEILEFLPLCRDNLREGGVLIFHSLNGANPITGSESLALNIDHFNTFTEYSMRQLLEHSGFEDINVIPLNLYVFYNNPLNYVGMVMDSLLTICFRVLFKFYGKPTRMFTKKIAAVARK